MFRECQRSKKSKGQGAQCAMSCPRSKGASDEPVGYNYQILDHNLR